MKTFAFLVCSLFMVGCVVAQKLPPISRTVFKCKDAGKVHYSDIPCIGATKIDVEPTRGLNKSSGKQVIGQDVRREESREMVAEALRPVTGMDAKQLDRSGRRLNLTSEIQRQCKQLDQQIPVAEQAANQASTKEEIKAMQEKLFELRLAFRKSGCD